MTDTTPVYSLPFPTATDPIFAGTGNVREAIQDLAESTESALSNVANDTVTEGDLAPLQAAIDAKPDDWTELPGKPSTFPPSAHSHAIADTTGLQAALDAKPDDWTELPGKPSTFPPSAHSHAIADTTGLQAALDSKTPITVGQPRLSNWFRKLGSDAANAKIIVSGDSTSDEAIGASVLYSRLRTFHTPSGGGLEGMIGDSSHIISAGNNGMSLSTWLANYDANDTSTKSLRWIIAQNPNLVVFSWGINDVRAGATTQAQLVTRIQRAVDILRAALPTTDIVLRVPNSFTTDDFGSNGYVSPNASAQAYTDLIRNAYLSIRGNWPNVLVWNSQDSVFGRTCLTKAATDRMSDQLHPSSTGYNAIADALVTDVIGLPIPYSPGLAKGARAIAGYWTAHTTYARAIEDTAYNDLVAIGEYVGQGANYVDFTWPGGAALAIRPYDVLEFGAGHMVYVLPTSIAPAAQGANTRIANAGTIPANTFTAGIVRVWRRKYGDATIEGVRQSSPGNMQIKAGIVANAGTGFIDVENYGYDRTLGKYWEVQKSTDTFYVQGVGVVSLSGSTVVPNGNRMRVAGLGATDYSPYIGNQAVFYSSSHVPEVPVTAVSVTFDPASVAANSTSDQTVTVPGAATGVAVLAVPPSGIAAGLSWSVWGSNNDQVTIRFSNPTGSAVDLPSGSWTFRIFK